MITAIYKCDNGDEFSCEAFTGSNPEDAAKYFYNNLVGYNSFSVELVSDIIYLTLTKCFCAEGKTPDQRCREYCKAMAELCEEMAEATASVGGLYAEREVFNLKTFAHDLQLFLEEMK